MLHAKELYLKLNEILGGAQTGSWDWVSASTTVLDEGIIHGNPMGRNNKRGGAGGTERWTEGVPMASAQARWSDLLPSPTPIDCERGKNRGMRFLGTVVTLLHSPHPLYTDSGFTINSGFLQHINPPLPLAPRSQQLP